MVASSKAVENVLNPSEKWEMKKMQKDRFNDWLFRYRYIYRSRLSDRSKKRFLNALVTDISQIRKDIRVIEYDLKHKAASRNVYIGDIAQADRIICTYYDTPPQHFGAYHFLIERRKVVKQ